MTTSNLDLPVQPPGFSRADALQLVGEPCEAMPMRAFLVQPLEIYWCP